MGTQEHKCSSCGNHFHSERARDIHAEIMHTTPTTVREFNDIEREIDSIQQEIDSMDVIKKEVEVK